MTTTPTRLLFGSMTALLMLSILACAGAQRSDQDLAEQEQQESDEAVLDRLDETYLTFKKTPMPAQFAAYINTLYNASADGVLDRHPDFEPSADEIEQAADLVIERAPYEKHNILAYEGIGLLVTGSVDDALESFHASLNEKPNFQAGKWLASIYGEAARPEQVASVCKRTVPHLNDQHRYELLETCRTQMHATTPEAAFHWARPEDVEFWAAQKDRRERAAAKEFSARQAAAAREQERRDQADAAERRAVQQHNARVDRANNEVQACASRCESRGHTCKGKCYGNQSCHHHCHKSYEACVEGCNHSTRAHYGL